jgi:stage V sporulation protein D (sporulation-specific penicillin-binding protein)
VGPSRFGVRRRILWCLGGAVLALLALAVRLFFLAAVEGPRLYQTALDVRTRVVPVQARRGDILDRNGHVLARSVGAESVYAIPAQVTDPDREAGEVARVLGLDPQAVAQRLAQRVMFVWIARKVPEAQARAVQALGLPGIRLLPETKRVYPRGMLAAQVLGFVGIDNQGLQGVELSYDRQLQGKPGAIVLETDARNQDIPGGQSRFLPAQDGLTLRLTIDAVLQGITQRALDAGVTAAHALGGYAIVMDPRTGEILAMAAWPTYDPNAAAQADPSLWTNPLLTYAFSPGSVFKPITGAAAMQEGLVTPDTGFYDTGVLRVGGRNIHNAGGSALGATTFRVGFQKSTNTIFGRVGLMLGRERFYKYLRLFGFFEPTGIDLPGESKRPNIIRPEHLATPLDIAEQSFGQTLAVTPISMITALSAIANGGELMWPHVGLDLEAPDGRVVQRIAPRVVRRVLSPEIAYQLQDLMAAVVAGGSGRNAAIPCYAVAGKTGTTQKYAAGGRGLSGEYIASFMGYAPAHGARVAAYVMIDEPQGAHYGGQVAAPIVRQILVQALAYLHVPPSCRPGERPPAPESPTVATVAMPSLLGQTPAEAERLAAAAGLYLRVEGSGPRVLRQVPQPGTEVERLSTVLAYTTPALALPVPTVTVPDLQGKTLLQAAEAVGLQGLQLDAQGEGVVIAQAPPPGAQLHPGDVVQVTLGPPGR